MCSGSRPCRTRSCGPSPGWQTGRNYAFGGVATGRGCLRGRFGGRIGDEVPGRRPGRLDDGVRIHRHLEGKEGLDPDRLRHRRHPVRLQGTLTRQPHQVLGEGQAQRVGRVVAHEEVGVAENRPADERGPLAEHDLRRREVEVALDRHAAGGGAGEDAAGHLVRRDRGGAGADLVELDVVGRDDQLRAVLQGHREVGHRQHVVEGLVHREHGDRALDRRHLRDHVGHGREGLGALQDAHRARGPRIRRLLGEPRGHRLDRALRRLDAHDGELGQEGEVEALVRGRGWPGPPTR